MLVSGQIRCEDQVMRSVVAFLLTTVCILFPAAASEPSEAVLKILKNAQDSTKNSKITNELAISSFCSKRKKEAIFDQWSSLGKWAREEAVEFSILDQKINGDLAGVVVAARGKSGPDGAQVLTFGTLYQNRTWKVAPISGQFTNSGIGFGEAERGRVQELEEWMSWQSVEGFTSFRKKELASYLKKLEGTVNTRVLNEASPKEAFNHFTEAIQKGHFEAVMVWLGILERTIHDDRNWAQLISVSRSGLKNQDQQKVWRLLTDSGVIRLIADEQVKKNSASFLLGFTAPYETGMDREKNRAIRFHLDKTPVGWRVKMPTFFASADEDSSAHFNAHQQEMDWKDRKFREILGGLFEKTHEARRANDPPALLAEIGKDLNAGNFANFARFLYRQPAAAEEKDRDAIRTARYATLSRWWTEFFGSKQGSRQIPKEQYFTQEFAVRPVLHYLDGKVALGVIRLETYGSWKPKFGKVWMMKMADGWGIAPSEKIFSSEQFKEEYASSAKRLGEKFDTEEQKLQETYLTELLAGIETLAEGGEAPHIEAGNKITTAWRAGLATGSVTAMLKRAAVLEIPEKPSKLINDLSATIKGVKAAKHPDQFLGSKSVGRFHGVSMMVDAGRGVEMHCPLMIVVPTQKGPRVLADVELWYPSNRGKRIRNSETLIRLEKLLSEEDYAAIQELFAWNEQLAGPAWMKWQKNNEE